jgi:phosphoglycolate phosphatase-like HAD superfamily hydrolase
VTRRNAIPSTIDISPTHVTTGLPHTPTALLLDFDGVILESVELKIQAFLTIYENETPEKLAQVLEYQSLHGGITRRIKFQYFEKHLFGRSGDPAEVERLSAAYTRLVHDAVLACPFVPGAEKFLQSAHDQVDLHVVSGTPVEELVDIIQRRGLSVYFKSVQGAPETKPEAFARILAQNGYEPARTLAVGDATTEYFAATDLGIPFLGVVPDGEPNPFPAHVPVVSSLETLDELVGVA